MSELMKPELELTEQAPVAITKQPGLKTTTTVRRGPWKTILGLGEACRVGFAAPTLIEGVTGRVAAVSATRQNGGLGTLELTMSEREATEVWNLDFMEIQKPIRAWHADAENEEDRPDLAALASWERLKDLDGAWEAYQGFYTSTEMSSSTQLSGATLTLAKKILKGVEAFNVYAPILTRVSVVNNLSELEDVGKDVGAICVPEASDDVVGSAAVATLAALAKQWLKTADSLQGALDGTFQRTETWVGAEQWDGDLYPGGDGSGEDGDEEGDLGGDPDLGDTDLGDNPELRP